MEIHPVPSRLVRRSLRSGAEVIVKATKVDFANVCAKARELPGRAVHIEAEREIMFCSADGIDFYLYFDTRTWHECANIQAAWDKHQYTTL
jgi:hypothetical protein